MPLNQSNHTENSENSNDPQNNKVFIQRDYSNGTVVKFQTIFPSRLTDKIEQSVLLNTINQINNYFKEAEESGCSTYCEGCLACITAYLIYLCSQTHYEKCLRKVAKYIAEQNQTVYEPNNLHITDPVERGLRVIEITILNEGTPNT